MLTSKTTPLKWSSVEMTGSEENLMEMMSLWDVDRLRFWASQKLNETNSTNYGPHLPCLVLRLSWPDLLWNIEIWNIQIPDVYQMDVVGGNFDV